jgi:FkbM family methyltransferase
MLVSLEKLVQRHRLNITGVLHCGAHEGQEAKTYAKLGVSKMIFVEADPDIFERLKVNLSKYQNAIPVNVCLSDSDGEEVEFKRTNNAGQSSSIMDLHLHKQSHPEVHVVDSIELKTKRLDSLLEELNINVHEFNFINCDLQCAELKALKGLGDKLSYFKYAYLEVNEREMYAGCPLIGEVDAYMKGFGFNRVHTEWSGNHGWGDALYIRK